jgi:hypothetical protein
MAWAKSAFTTTASAAWRMPPTSTPVAFRPSKLMRSISEPRRISTPRRSATRAIAEETAPQPPTGWKTPCSYSRKERMVKRLGQRKGLIPRYLVWKEKARRTRGSLKYRARSWSTVWCGRISGRLFSSPGERKRAGEEKAFSSTGRKASSFRLFSAKKGRRPAASPGFSRAISASMRRRRT